ncbi:MAG: biotin-dependent carboxyltransferase family protein [Phycisphaerales bacterium]|nr:MAG: biotin-dependent carboxyltransferase family protein [Phycisphaerales bacterium]
MTTDHPQDAPTARVLEPGMFTTVQDMGRPGHGSIGVPPSGACDTTSLRVANRLLHNDDGAGALECTLLGPVLRFTRDAVVCLTGAVCPKATVGEGERARPLAACVPHRVLAGERVAIGGLATGARAYLAIDAGFDLPPVLGSVATLASARLGGHRGRALRAGDDLPLAPPSPRPPREPSEPIAPWLTRSLARRTLRVTPALHADLFDNDAMRTLTSEALTVADQSDRVGVRLRGPSLRSTLPTGSLESEGAITGAIQVPHDAPPIILGVDRPTTGGYPVLACVIAADLPILAALRPRDTVRFALVTRRVARELHRAHERELDAHLPPAGTSQ